jgi:hypothetical protein
LRSIGDDVLHHQPFRVLLAKIAVHAEPNPHHLPQLPTTSHVQDDGVNELFRVCMALLRGVDLLPRPQRSPRKRELGREGREEMEDPVKEKRPPGEWLLFNVTTIIQLPGEGEVNVQVALERDRQHLHSPKERVDLCHVGITGPIIHRMRQEP